jgi:hypothetical protein
MKAMPSKLLMEWVAYFQIEHEEEEKLNLTREAIVGVSGMKAKRKR